MLFFIFLISWIYQSKFHYAIIDRISKEILFNFYNDHIVQKLCNSFNNTKAQNWLHNAVIGLELNNKSNILIQYFSSNWKVALAYWCETLPIIMIETQGLKVTNSFEWKKQLQNAHSWVFIHENQPIFDINWVQIKTFLGHNKSLLITCFRRYLKHIKH